jgi:hypothetical protein
MIPTFRRLATFSLAALPVAIAVVRASVAEPLPHPNPPEAGAANAIARTVADSESAARDRAREAFPGDRWSQDDDFHNHEARLARRLAATHRTGLDHVFAIIDADLRSQRVPARKATAAPCKPRPFYE